MEGDTQLRTSDGIMRKKQMEQGAGGITALHLFSQKVTQERRLVEGLLTIFCHHNPPIGAGRRLPGVQVSRSVSLANTSLAISKK